MQKTQIKPVIQQEAGFSLLEMVIAMSLMSVGLLAVAAAISFALASSTTSRNVSESKQIITQTMEQIESLRNTRQLRFEQIANTGSVDNSNSETNFAGFSTGFVAVASNPGSDGVYGTPDDPAETQTTNSNSRDNPNRRRDSFKRRITISSINPLLKKIEVTTRYNMMNGKTIELTGVSYLNDDSHGTLAR